MRHPTLSGIVKRRFLHYVHIRDYTVRGVVDDIGITPGDLCRLISHQNIGQLPITTFFQTARWLRMSLANVIALAGTRPKLSDLVKLGMMVQGYNPTSSADQIQAANDVGVSVAVFRRALHGYESFKPAIRTCDQFADWLAWTGFTSDDIATAAGMIVCYQADGERVIISPDVAQAIKPYPCACGRAGCMVPAHIPNGPRRKWRSDACRMWAKRNLEPEAASLPHSSEIMRFIMINERRVPVRF
ncbi:MAG: hypothetical protein JXA10_02245 [Anaerolineae bacterium]|nr:hypothetical protein [Anaerolineae bacterium]